MKFRKIEWVKTSYQYSTGQVAKVGRITIGNTFWNSCRTKDKENKLVWIAGACMNGIKERLGTFKTEKDAMKVIEKAYKYWQGLLTED